VHGATTRGPTYVSFLANMKEITEQAKEEKNRKQIIRKTNARNQEREVNKEIIKKK
jgi:hypothetical protein